MDGSRRRILTSKALCGAVASLALALAACSNSSVHGKSSAAPTATHLPTPTATVSLAAAHADWTTLASTPPGAVNFTFAPSNPQIGYICTSVNTYTSQEQPKLYKTTDGGQTWAQVSGLPAIQVPSGLGSSPQLFCRAFVEAADPNDVFLQQIVFATSGAGYAVARALYRSHDGGATWGAPLGTLDRTDGFDRIAVVGTRLISRAHPSVYGARGCNASQPLPPEQPSNVLYVSDDGGQTWQQLGQSIEDQHLAVVDMATMGDTIFATAHTLFPGGCDAFQPVYSLWRSADAGASWQRVAIPADGTLSQLSFTRHADGSGYCGVVVTTAQNADGSYRSGLIFTSDSGATWSPIQAAPSALAGTGGSLTAATPSGAIVEGGLGGIVAIRPSDPSPAWRPYAPSATFYVWQIVQGPQGAILWVLATSEATSELRYLPLP